MNETRPASESAPLSGASIVSAMKMARVETVVAVPDIVTCDAVLRPVSVDCDLRLVQVCKEDEGVSICAALSYCDVRSILLIQHTGFLDSINAIRAIAVEYQLPVVMMIGLQGMEPDRAPWQSLSLGIRMLEPICRSMELPYIVLENERDASKITPAVEYAYADSHPVALLVARTPK